MLNVIMLNVVILNVILLGVLMLDAFMQKNLFKIILRFSQVLA